MIRRPPRSTQSRSSAASDVYKRQLQSYPNLENALGDGIYSARWITDLVAKSNVTPYFLPKSNVTFQSKGFDGWYDMLFSLWKDPQIRLEQYHMRSISETCLLYT